MSIAVTDVRAEKNLGELLNLVSIQHEEIIIERAGKKIARLTAIEEEINTVNEPITEEYTVQKKSGSTTDFSLNFGTQNEEECHQVMDSVKSGRRINPELQASALETELIQKHKRWVAMSDQDAKRAVEQFRSIRGMGKEMWEATGLTPDEYVRKEREEWAADPQTVREAIQNFRTLRGLGKEMWEATGLTPDEYVRKEREEWD